MIQAAEILPPVTTEVASIKAFMQQCREDGIDLDTPLGVQVLRIWLESPTSKICRCRERLRTWERLNAKCDRCVAYERRRVEEAIAGRTVFAR